MCNGDLNLYTTMWYHLLIKIEKSKQKLDIEDKKMAKLHKEDQAMVPEQSSGGSDS
jgi:hypothetical protein